jgi:hypothetical protein
MQQKIKEVLPIKILHMGDTRYILSTESRINPIDTGYSVSNAIPDPYSTAMLDYDYENPKIDGTEKPIYPYTRTLLLSNTCPYWIECLSMLDTILVEDRNVSAPIPQKEHKSAV